MILGATDLFSNMPKQDAFAALTKDATSAFDTMNTIYKAGAKSFSEVSAKQVASTFNAFEAERNAFLAKYGPYADMVTPQNVSQYTNLNKYAAVIHNMLPWTTTDTKRTLDSYIHATVTVKQALPTAVIIGAAVVVFILFRRKR